MKYLYIIPAWLCYFYPFISFAATWETSLASMAWQYQERSPQRIDMGSTPFQSSSQGMAMQVTIQNTITWNKWGFSSSWQGLQSLQSSQEQWSFRQSTQSDQLSMQQSELQFNLSHKWSSIQWGLGTAYQWHQQSRKTFIVNHIPISVAGEPIKETIQTLWLDTHIIILWHAWSIVLTMGIPTWVHTSNTLIPTAFTSKQGFRTQISCTYKPQKSPWTLQARYSYRELGGQLLRNAWLWPKNRWQTASLGVSYAW